MIATNYPTLYELVATHPDGRRVLVCYTRRKGRRDLWEAVVKNDIRRNAMIALTQAEVLTFGKRVVDGATMGEWSIRYSGRTQRDCQGSELPFVGRMN